MAEVGIVASIIGIAGAGAKLSLELYEFGATVSTARHETNSIARSVSHYSRTLKVLGKRLQDERPIHSQDALVLVGEIRDHSVSVLGQIRSMIPRRARDNSLSFKKRLRWTFRKTKVEFLLGRLDAEKATLTLLVQILYTGNIIRTAKYAYLTLRYPTLADNFLQRKRRQL